MAEEAVTPIDPIVPSETVEAQGDQENQVEQSETVQEERPSYSGTKHLIKIDNDEREIDYDELVRGYQKSSASDKKFREASEIRKKVDFLINNLKSGDHNNLVKLLGKEQAKKMAEDLLTEEIEYEQLPEHEKTIRQLEFEKRQAEEKLKAQETARQTSERQRLEHQAAVEIETDIVGAIKESNIKPTPRLMARLAEVMEAHIIKTGQKLKASDALKIVRGEIPRDFISYVDGLNKEGILALKKELPKEFLDVLRRDDVEAVLSQTPIGKGRTEINTPPPKKSKSKNRMTTDNWFQEM